MWYSAVGCVVTLTLSLLVAPLIAEAQQAKIPRLGVLTEPSRQAGDNAFRQALHALGYVEGHTIAFAWRVADTPAQFPALVAELVGLQVDILVVQTGTMARAAKQATSTIPIVMAASDDPVLAGLVASLAAPSGNVTGLSGMSPDLSPKALELLKEALPAITRVAVFTSRGQPGGGVQRTWEYLQVTAQRLGLHLQYLEVQRTDPAHFEALLTAAVREGADALLTVDCRELNGLAREQVAGLAAQHRLPGVYHFRSFVVAGGLMSYAPNLTDKWPRVATYVDKILKGSKPADLPVEQPMTLDLVINLKTAKALGITFPPTILIQANEVLQ